MDQKEIRRRRASIAARERRRKRRKRIVLMQKMAIALIGVIIIVGGSLLAYFLIPEIKVAKQLEEANAYIETQAYDEAIASCEQALEIDSTSVQAYRAMAGAYLTKEDSSAAEQILYRGWETTQDESLLQYYCTVLLNEAVADINTQSCTLVTMDKCVSVIEKDQVNADGYNLLNVCFERLFLDAPEQEGLLCNVSIEGECGYKVYQDMMYRLLLTYENSPAEELKEAILKLAVPGSSTIWMDVEHLQDYKDLLGRVEALGSNEEVSDLVTCIEKAGEVLHLFEEAFTIFESGEFESIKDFMHKEEYIAIRDEFIAGTMEHWYGKTYIPVNREKMKFIKEEGSWMFAFADYEECGNSIDIVNVWGAKQEDAGVQRLCISYEPASENGEYFPHTTYEFIYLYSNVQIGNEYVPMMNYRFETRVAMPEGTNTDLIGDWGGDYEWETTY